MLGCVQRFPNTWLQRKAGEESVGGGSHMRMIKQSLEYYVAIMNHLCQVFFVVDVFNVGQA